jgi:hypothetical protein
MNAKHKGKIAILLVLIATGMLVTITSMKKKAAPIGRGEKSQPKSCVYKTIFGEEKSDSFAHFKTPESTKSSVKSALKWLAAAQNSDGGWGAGSHYNQQQFDPHAVKSDPASTAISCMAIMRSGSSFTQGEFQNQLQKGLNYLLAKVENANENSANITDQQSTQPQMKLGANIDVVLSSQFLTNALDYAPHDQQLYSRIKKAAAKCVRMIEHNQQADGSQRGDGWAGVLQSSFANNALESAKEKGIAVNTKKLEESRNYQKQNYDAKTGSAKTERAAGVMLYSVSGSVRASAPEAKIAQEKIAEAKRNGTLKASESISAESLRKAGMNESDAMKYAAAYEINQSAKQKAQQQDVMQGFGNNGGEEFLSYLQTGESLIIARDNDWKNWYNNVSGKLISTQNNNGSWNGHHCITSPVFCTATCLLILTVQNDIDKLAAL